MPIVQSGPVRKKPGESPPPLRNTTLALVGFNLLIFLGGFDSTAFNLSLSQIQHDLKLSLEMMTWVFDSYLLGFGTLIIPAGRFGDLFGYNRMLRLGALIFIVTSLLAGFSSSGTYLICMRVGQGISTALYNPAIMAMILRRLPIQMHKSALGILMGSLALGLSMGPLLSGIFMQYLTWAWIFFFISALAAAAMCILWVTIPGSVRDVHAEQIDIPGALLLCVGAFGFLYTIQLWGKEGFYHVAPTIWLCITLVALILLYFREKTAKSPLIQMNAFKDERFGVYIFMRAAGAFSNFSIAYLFAYFLQKFFLLEPLIAGLYFLPINLSQAFFSVMVGRWENMSPLSWMRLGHLLQALTLCLIVIVLLFSYDFVSLCIPFILYGMSYGFFITTNSLAALGRIADKHRGVGSSILYMTVYFAGALAVMIGSVLMRRLGPALFYSDVHMQHFSVPTQKHALIHDLFQGRLSVPAVLKALPKNATKVFSAIEQSAVQILQIDLLICATLVITASFFAYWMTRKYSV